MSKKKKSRRPFVATKDAQEQGVTLSRGILDTYEGQRLDGLLDKIWRSIESAKPLKRELPDKIWIKQQFAIGVNDVTRLLERMPQIETTGAVRDISCSFDNVMRKATLVSLQVVLVAADCNPKWLTKHIPALASSRKVPVILVRDGKGGSLRLGGLLNVKTALAIGVKAKGSCINAAFEEIICKS
ncbi:uncharacterized protein LOC110102047 isoform X2 [Dendrobium catenatum]|uniref:Ribosomal protein eL8/eL30/eS12/Gadd45 domain-containing protein n=1 Tax=Dendrobium catenatum TaxID=906689 RepID=A0A2I0V7G1_9ASPA|nr:uncharacterized protein LOC110102047 isoform X2 [Dendrobium catenatum]PKU59350.1 hypothetical protein MA16_Dca023558 [Dendrobium catenatum]